MFVQHFQFITLVNVLERLKCSTVYKYYRVGRQEILISWTRTKITVLVVKYLHGGEGEKTTGKYRGVILVHCLVKTLNLRGTSRYSFHTNIITVHVFPWE